MPLIGIVGHKRAGKDTVADILLPMFHGFSRKYAVADPLKEAVKAIFRFTDAEMEDKETPVARLGISPREALQKIGTDVVRKQFADLFPKLKPKNMWIHALEHEIAECKDGLFIVPDVRFEDEARCIRANKGLLIRVYRKSADSVLDSHASEAGVDAIKADIEIHNDGTIEELTEKIHELRGRLIGNSN